MEDRGSTESTTSTWKRKKSCFDSRGEELMRANFRLWLQLLRPSPYPLCTPFQSLSLVKKEEQKLDKEVSLPKVEADVWKRHWKGSVAEGHDRKCDIYLFIFEYNYIYITYIFKFLQRIVDLVLWGGEACIWDRSLVRNSFQLFAMNSWCLYVIKDGFEEVCKASKTEEVGVLGEWGWVKGVRLKGI